MNNITTHLQIHKNKIAVDECLKRFRLHFPNLPIHIHGDNGDDFSYLKEKYNVEYKHWNTSISPRGLSGGNWKGYLERVLLTCQTYPNEWVLFLEEDVNTLHNNIIFPISDFAGIKGHPFSKEFTTYIKNLHPNLSVIQYNMCGGSICKMKSLVDSIESVLNGKFDLDEISKLDDRIIHYSDVLISAVLLLGGNVYGEWEQLSETASGVYKNNPVFDHSWKEFYDKNDWKKFINFNMKDVVIGCITNYTFENIKLFVNSIDRSGFTGHKVMIVYNVPFSTVDELRKRDWIVVTFNEDVQNQRYTYRDNFIVTVDRHLHYYLTLKQLAEVTPEGLRYVLALDPKDVIFQYNPSEWLEKNLGHYKINAGRESVKYEHEVWGRSNIIESFGEVLYDRCKENITVNAGTLSGEWEIMSELFLNVYLMCQGSPSATPDQAAVNIALSLSPYKELTRFTNSEEAWAAQCGTTVDQRMVNQYGENLLEPSPIMDGDIVKTSTGIPFAMVHQYDRIPEWNQIITKKYE